MKEKSLFLNPFSDVGFKRLFGKPENKDLLIDFINALMEGKKEIVDCTFLQNRYLEDRPEWRTTLIDLECICEEGESSIVQLQRVEPYCVKSVSLYYASACLCEQGLQKQEGGESYDLKEAFVFCIMDHCFDGDHTHKPVHTFKLREMETREVMCEGLVYKYLEMPLFRKDESELTTRLDEWMYLLNHLQYCVELPDLFEGDEIFEKLFKEARLSGFTEEELKQYQQGIAEMNSFRNIIKNVKKEAWLRGAKYAFRANMENDIPFFSREETGRIIKRDVVAVEQVIGIMMPGNIEDDSVYVVRKKKKRKKHH